MNLKEQFIYNFIHFKTLEKDICKIFSHLEVNEVGYISNGT